MDGNPFGAAGGTPQQPPPTDTLSSNNNAMAGNPFDPIAAPAAPVQQAAGMGMPPQQQPPPFQNGSIPAEMPKDPMMATTSMAPPPPAAAAPPNDNPFGAPGFAQQQPPQAHQQAEQRGSIYSQPPSGALSPPQQQQEQRGSICGQPPAMPASPTTTASAAAAMVVANQQSNPYATPATPGAMVPAPQQASPWGVAAPATAGAPSASFDPFAAPPAPPPAPVASPQPAYPQASQEFSVAPVAAAAAPPSPQQAPMAAETQMVPAGAPQPLVVQQQQQPPPPTPETQQQQPSQQPMEQQLNRYDPSSAPPPTGGRDYGAVNRQDPESNYAGRDVDAPRHVEEERDRQQAMMGRELQRTAAMPGASPLPKPELVRKKGFILSRISFRTIVMKKWKQAYWVQYGPHTMLWFRSQTDFNDWLNNPYHNQAQRNFLIKLAVNFVHDLYKPSVRGYQVTQCRTKPYGSKMIRQFKLERWMDYGPTIAAAFGSYNPKEVDDLRQAIVECMRNTPLNNGIRATGAVRQQPSRSSDEGDHSPTRAAAPPAGEQQPPQEMRHTESQDSDRRQYASADGAVQQGAHDFEKEGKESDLLDLDNWEDVSVQDHSVVPYVPGQGAPPTTPGVAPGQAAGMFGASPQQPNPYGAPPPAQPQASPYGAPQASQEFAAPNVYGAPPPQASQEFAAPGTQAVYGVPPQASQEFAAPPAAYGAPAQQQQPANANLYGAPPPQPQPTPYGSPAPPGNPFGAPQPPTQQTF